MPGRLGAGAGDAPGAIALTGRSPHMRTSALQGITAASLALLLTACANLPAGPSLQALPGSRKTPEQFAVDDGECRRVATAQIGGTTPSEAANQSVAATAAAGTAIGAVTGALIDGSSGAAAGAGMGLLFGTMAGSATAQGTYAAAQQQFDGAYYACMYARGHKVPVPAHSVARFRSQYRAAYPEPSPSAAPPAPLPPPDYHPPTTPR